MAGFESLDYRLPNNQVRRQHVWTSAQKEWQKWLVFILIGLSVGSVSFMLYQCIGYLDYTRLAYKDDPLYFVGISVLYGTISAGIVVFGAPVARGSGVPGVIAYLNGVRVKSIFRIRTLIVKFISCSFSVASGLPVGQEGPMIALGAAVGAGVGAGNSDTLQLHTCGFFKYFQNSRDLRDFITGGVAAGVAAAFNAPVGGLLFTMEEISSNWSKRLSWMIFLCCMIAVLWNNLWKSGVSGFSATGTFGLISPDLISFQVSRPEDDEEEFLILVVIPAAVIGVIGGVLGAIFTFFNLKVTRFRLKYINHSRWRMMLETILICLLFGVFSSALPHVAGNCLRLQGQFNDTHAVTAGCEEGYYNDLGSLTLNGGHGAVNDMLSRGTFGFYSKGSLGLWLFFYFVFAAYTAGVTAAVGTFVPMLYIGALVGRLFGRIFIGIGIVDEGVWGDPGLYALIGCGAFGAGLSRLTMSLAVIMIEISDSVNELLPIMVGIMFAKWTADYLTHSLDHSILHLQSLPHLSPEPTDSTLPCFNVSEIMAPDPVCLPLVPSMEQIVEALNETTHNAFPVVAFDVKNVPRRFHDTEMSGVVKSGNSDNRRNTLSVVTEGQHEDEKDLSTGFLVGLINRNQLLQLLQSETLLRDSEGEASKVREVMEDFDFQLGKRDTLTTDHITEKKLTQFIDLTPYVNTSTISLSHTFEVEQAYELFVALGLRHLVIVNSRNNPVGMITRKDLLGQNIEEKLEGQHIMMEATRHPTRRPTYLARGSAVGVGRAPLPIAHRTKKKESVSIQMSKIE